MKQLLLILAISLSFNNYAEKGDCHTEMQQLITIEYAWDIKHNNATAEATLMNEEDIIQAIEWNNADLEQDTVEEIMAFVNEPEVEFYNFYTETVGGSATMVMVNKWDCSILERYHYFDE